MLVRCEIIPVPIRPTRQAHQHLRPRAAHPRDALIQAIRPFGHRHLALLRHRLVACREVREVHRTHQPRLVLQELVRVDGRAGVLVV